MVCVAEDGHGSSDESATEKTCGNCNTQFAPTIIDKFYDTGDLCFQINALQMNNLDIHSLPADQVITMEDLYPQLRTSTMTIANQPQTSPLPRIPATALSSPPTVLARSS
jgi:hypothetical protein